MNDADYANREIDQKLEVVAKNSNDNRVLLMGRLDEIFDQTKRTNGRVTKLERWMMIVGTATAVTIILKFPEIAPLLKLI